MLLNPSIQSSTASMTTITTTNTHSPTAHESDYPGNVYMTEGSNYTTLDPVFSVFWCSKCKDDGGCSSSNLVGGYDHICWHCNSALPNAE